MQIQDPAFNYDRHGQHYSGYRQTDPRIAAHIWQALGLGGRSEVKAIPVPFDCADGFQEAFYGRPEAFLDSQVRLSQSAWGFLDEGQEEQLVRRLEEDLKSGEWDKRYGFLRNQPEFVCALRLIVAYNG